MLPTTPMSAIVACPRPSLARGKLLLAFAVLSVATGSCSSGHGAAPTASDETAAATSSAVQPLNTPTSDQAAVLAVVRSQALFNAQKDWPGLYTTYSPAQQAACPYDKFVQKISGIRAARPDFDIAKVSFDRFRVRSDGDHAKVSYGELYEGQVVCTVDTANPDHYV